MGPHSSVAAAPPRKGVTSGGWLSAAADDKAFLRGVGSLSPRPPRAQLPLPSGAPHTGPPPPPRPACSAHPAGSLQIEQMFAAFPPDVTGNLDYKNLVHIITHGEEKD